MNVWEFIDKKIVLIQTLLALVATVAVVYIFDVDGFRAFMTFIAVSLMVSVSHIVYLLRRVDNNYRKVIRFFESKEQSDRIKDNEHIDD